MLLSVVIPVFNTKKYLYKCLNSIRNQHFEDYEVIVVDDGSTDGSSQICDEFSKKDKRFSVYHCINSGVSVARNYGIAHARGDYITFVDSDDYLFPFYFEKIANKIFETNPDVVVTAGYYWGNEEEKSAIRLNLPHNINTENDLLFKLLADRIYPSGLVFSVFKRSIAQQIKLDEKIYFYEDLDYQLRAGAIITNISVNDEIGYLYRKGSQTHCKFTDRTVSCFLIIEKMEKGEIKLEKSLITKFKYNFLISNALVAAKDEKHNKKLDMILKEKAKHFCLSKEWFTTFRKPYLWIAIIAVSPCLYYKLYRLKHNVL